MNLFSCRKCSTISTERACHLKGKKKETKDLLFLLYLNLPKNERTKQNKIIELPSQVFREEIVPLVFVFWLCVSVEDGQLEVWGKIKIRLGVEDCLEKWLLLLFSFFCWVHRNQGTDRKMRLDEISFCSMKKKKL